MRARHRLSNPAVAAWDPLLRRRRLDRQHDRCYAATRSTGCRCRRPRLAFDADHEAVLAMTARRDRLDTAWHHRTRYLISKNPQDRWDLAPAAARLRGDDGNRRLHHRWVRFIARNNDRPPPTPRSPAKWLAGAGQWPSSTIPRPPVKPPDQPLPRSARVAARGERAMSTTLTGISRSLLDTRTPSSRSTVCPAAARLDLVPPIAVR
jgi:hypothetical protein